MLLLAVLFGLVFAQEAEVPETNATAEDIFPEEAEETFEPYVQTHFLNITKELMEYEFFTSQNITIFVEVANNLDVSARRRLT